MRAFARIVDATYFELSYLERMEWGFYGRRSELDQLRAIIDRDRWFFAKISGRRRIGKTTLIQQALRDSNKPVLYMQVPDSGPAGVL